MNKSENVQRKLQKYQDDKYQVFQWQLKMFCQNFQKSGYSLVFMVITVNKGSEKLHAITPYSSFEYVKLK